MYGVLMLCFGLLFNGMLALGLACALTLAAEWVAGWLARTLTLKCEKTS